MGSEHRRGRQQKGRTVSHSKQKGVFGLERAGKRAGQKFFRIHATIPRGWGDVICGSCYIVWVSFRGSVDRGGDATAFFLDFLEMRMPRRLQRMPQRLQGGVEWRKRANRRASFYLADFSHNRPLARGALFRVASSRSDEQLEGALIGFQLYDTSHPQEHGSSYRSIALHSKVSRPDVCD